MACATRTPGAKKAKMTKRGQGCEAGWSGFGVDARRGGRAGRDSALTRLGVRAGTSGFVVDLIGREGGHVRAGRGQEGSLETCPHLGGRRARFGWLTYQV